MPSDPHRVDQALKHIRRITAGTYPVITGNSAEWSGAYRITIRPWQDLDEPKKLAILQDAVDWSGITNHDQAHILLSEIDPGKITAAQRTRSIAAATGLGHHERDNLRDELFPEARTQPQPDQTHQRNHKR